MAESPTTSSILRINPGSYLAAFVSVSTAGESLGSEPRFGTESRACKQHYFNTHLTSTWKRKSNLAASRFGQAIELYTSHG